MLDVPNDGIIALDWLGEPESWAAERAKDASSSRKSVLLVLHGLTGGSHETYVQWLVATAVRERGMAAVVMNARGCAGTSLASAQGYCGAWTEDVRASVRHIRERAGTGVRVFAAGFSLGAGILTKYLVEEGSEAGIDGAVALCASFDFVRSIYGMETRWDGFPYRGVLTKALQRYLGKHKASLIRFGNPAGVDIEMVERARIPREFDHAVVAPMFGYKSAWDYYHDASTARFVADRVAVPYLALNAEDDPICDVRGVPTWAASKNPCVFFGLTREGGHVAWATGLTASGKYWYEDVCMTFFDAIGSGKAPERRKGIPRLVGRASVACGVAPPPFTIGASGDGIACSSFLGTESPSS